MLSKEENDLLTRIGPATAAGELMRRYWQPVALAEELPLGGPPLPLRLLGEDLVLFRDGGGRPGLLALHCSHRGADLSYGRLEHGGIRCIYHGWLYDIHGQCLEQPGEPADSTFHQRIHHAAYLCREVGGLILTYMGPGDPPLVPGYEFLMAPEERRFATKVYHDCNYLQGNEGNLDPTHNSYLHWELRNERDLSPTVEPEETDFGVHIRRLRRINADTCGFSTSNFILPNLSAFPGSAGGDGYTVNWHVPIDDEHHWKYIIQFRRQAPLDEDAFWRGRCEITDGYRLIRSRANRYLQDREEMTTQTFSGLGTGFQAHDACAVEGAGPIQDRTQEHLGYTDRGIIAERKALVRAIREVQAGREAPHVVRDPARNHFPGIVVTTEVVHGSVDWSAYWQSRGSAPAGWGTP